MGKQRIIMKTFTFGKYKGQEISKIIHTNPNYVKWCAENVSFFNLSVEQGVMLHEELEKVSYDSEVRYLMHRYGMHATEAMDFLDYDVPEYF